MVWSILDQARTIYLRLQRDAQIQLSKQRTAPVKRGSSVQDVGASANAIQAFSRTSGSIFETIVDIN